MITPLIFVFVATSLRAPCFDNHAAHVSESDTVLTLTISKDHYSVADKFFARPLAEFSYAAHKNDVKFLLRFLRSRFADANPKPIFNIVEDDACYCERPPYEQIVEKAEALGCGIVNLSVGMMSILLRYDDIDCVYRQIELCDPGGIDVCAHHCAPCFTARDYFYEKQTAESTLGHAKWEQNDCSADREHDARFWFLPMWNNWIPNESIVSLNL